MFFSIQVFGGFPSIFLLLTSSLIVLWSENNFIYLHTQGPSPTPHSQLLKDFLIFKFLKFVCDMPICRFGGIFFCLMFSEISKSVVWCQLLILENFQSLLLQIFLLFLSLFSFWYSHYVCVTTSVIIPGLVYSVLFHFSFSLHL